MASISNAFVQRKRKAHTPKKGKASTSGLQNQINVDAKENQDLKILKQFDLTLEYGPCIGIARLDRWERADKHGLNPPPEVKDLINSHATDPTYTECLWNDYNTLR